MSQQDGTPKYDSRQTREGSRDLHPRRNREHPSRMIPPNPVPRTPMDRTAEILKHDRRLLPYQVHRRYGIGNLQHPDSYHWTRRAAERAARRWTRTRPQPSNYSTGCD